jgi:hypothetical protein
MSPENSSNQSKSKLNRRQRRGLEIAGYLLMAAPIVPIGFGTVDATLGQGAALTLQAEQAAGKISPSVSLKELHDAHDLLSVNSTPPQIIFEMPPPVQHARTVVAQDTRYREELARQKKINGAERLDERDQRLVWDGITAAGVEMAVGFGVLDVRPLIKRRINRQPKRGRFTV